jgi:hypothetical protein
MRSSLKIPGSEFIIHIFLGGTSLLGTICWFAIAADGVCSGTGTGQNEVLLLCQAYAPIILLALNLFLFGGLPALLCAPGVRPAFRIMASIAAALLMFVLSPFVWQGSPLLTRVK